MTSPWIAWPQGSDPAAARLAAAGAHESFVCTGQASGIRPVVLDSWRRCARSGVDPERMSPAIALTGEQLRRHRADHPLAAVLPLVRRLLVESAADAGQIVALADAAGRLLWVEGHRDLRSRAESMGFVPGACWLEEEAGTNAPGTALALDHAVQIFAGEHFSRAVHPWSCAAAPLHDPDTGRLLGVLDVTGGDHVAAPQALALVRAAAAAAEAELRLQRHQTPAAPRRSGPHRGAAPLPRARLEVLGRDRALLTADGRTWELAPRHSEILLLLARHSDGLSADSLAAMLHEEESAGVTVRAEISRLRRLVGNGLLASRPYRITTPIRTDIEEVRELLGRGAHRQAVQRCRGPVLPRSEAPGVVEEREALAGELRAVLLRHACPELLADWALRPEGSADPRVLQAAVLALPPGSPRRTVLGARLAALGPRSATFRQPSRG